MAGHFFDLHLRDDDGGSPARQNYGADFVFVRFFLQI